MATSGILFEYLETDEGMRKVRIAIDRIKADIAARQELGDTVWFSLKGINQIISPETEAAIWDIWDDFPEYHKRKLTLTLYQMAQEGW